MCSGGDGTIDEVVTGMMKRQEKNPIGYIPTGTTNDFANSLHIPRNLLGAADNAVNGVVFPCDVGKFNDGTFVYIAAFGLFTDVSYETKQGMKNVLGHLAYVLEGTKRLFNVPSYRIRVTHDDEVIEDEFIYGMVTNSRSVGGFRNMVGKQVVFDDGLFEVTLIKTPKNPIALQEIIAALLIEQVDTKHMYSFKTGKIEFESLEEISWTLDGEYGGSHDNPGQNGVLVFHLYGIVFVTYKTYNEMTAPVGFGYGKSTVLTSGYPTGNILPENVGTDNRFAGLIFHRTAHLRLYSQTAEKQSGQ